MVIQPKPKTESGLCVACEHAAVWIPTAEYPGGYWTHANDGTQFDHFAHVGPGVGRCLTLFTAPHWTEDPENDCTTCHGPEVA